ncbi:MAG: bifunctional metallophosphatase/5'-nucleotidase [Alphaproteobacteria bacterium]|nr:bifunctional metallophosphatase/5'-nucleotidase [Alphaproteobacteria bacterium]
MSLFRRLSSLVLVALLLASIATLAPVAALAQSVKLTLLHTNDVYEISPVRGRGGLAELATLLKRERAQAQHHITTFGGDLISPSLMSGLTKGAQMIELYNALGTDLAVFGNHEFDFGDDVLKARMNESKFPWMAGNLTGADGKLFHTAIATSMKEYGGLKFGFFGVITPETVHLASPGKDLKFEDYLAASARLVKQLKDQGADVVVALTHINIAEDRELARRVKGIDLILGGHDHEPITWYEGTTLIHKAGYDAHWLAVVELNVNKRAQASGPPRVEVMHSWKMIPTMGVQPDPEIAAIVKKHNDKLDVELNVEIGTSTVAMSSKRDDVRTKETAIGNLISDAIREAVGADVGLTNGGGIRGDKTYDAGVVLKRRDILTELPFGNKTVLLELKGSDLKEAMETSVGRVEEKQGRFMQVSGMTLVFDPKAERGKRVVEIKVAGQPLDPNKTYKVATNEYVAAGGDGFEVLKKGKSMIDESAAKLMASQVIDYIAAKKTVSPKVEGRITEK